MTRKIPAPAMGWDASCIDDQTGRLAVVTGGNSGLGFATARGLLAKNVEVVLACRNARAGKDALERLRDGDGTAETHVMLLDLADLKSVRRFSDEFGSRFSRLDLLINNAGVIFSAKGITSDGFELIAGTNHLGHFALTGHLLPVLERTTGSRVVCMSSAIHHFGRVDCDTFARGGNSGLGAYASSKLANLLFAYELNLRLEAKRSSTRALGVHPGAVASPALQKEGPLTRALSHWFLTPEQGALSSLRAATDPDLEGGECIGPAGLFGLFGHPERCRSSRRSHDRNLARRLWETSEFLTGVWYL